MNDATTGLRNNDQDTENPFSLFNEWLNSAVTSELNDPSAMSVATVDDKGMPNVRIVLMRRFDERGFCFFTNFESKLSTGKLRSSSTSSNVSPTAPVAPTIATLNNRELSVMTFLIKFN